MRGATDPQETLGAQELKSQYGSTRIRDKQSELVRCARDLVEITTEIITEKFNPVTMIEMSQTTLPTQQMIGQQVKQLQMKMQQQAKQAQQMMQNPQAQQMAQQKPDMAKQAIEQFQQAQQQVQDQIQKLQQKPTIEQVLSFLKNTRIKAFVLDIETDSTIRPTSAARNSHAPSSSRCWAACCLQLAQMIAAKRRLRNFAASC